MHISSSTVVLGWKWLSFKGTRIKALSKAMLNRNSDNNYFVYLLVVVFNIIYWSVNSTCKIFFLVSSKHILSFSETKINHFNVYW